MRLTSFSLSENTNRRYISYNYLNVIYDHIFLVYDIFSYSKGEVYSMQHYVIKFVSDLRQGGGFVRVLWFPPSKNAWPPRYCWNIVESGVNHNNANLIIPMYFTN